MGHESLGNPSKYGGFPPFEALGPNLPVGKVEGVDGKAKTPEETSETTRETTAFGSGQVGETKGELGVVHVPHCIRIASPSPGEIAPYPLNGTWSS